MEVESVASGDTVQGVESTL